MGRPNGDWAVTVRNSWLTCHPGKARYRATSDSDAYRVDGDDVVVRRHGAITTHERRQQHQIRRPAVPYMCHKQGRTGVRIGFQRRTTSRVLTCGFAVFMLGNSGGQIDLGNHCSIP